MNAYRRRAIVASRDRGTSEAAMCRLCAGDLLRLSLHIRRIAGRYADGALTFFADNSFHEWLAFGRQRLA